MSNLTVAARRVLADRTEFVLDARAAEAWDAVNRRRPRELAGLRVTRVGAWVRGCCRTSSFEPPTNSTCSC